MRKDEKLNDNELLGDLHKYMTEGMRNIGMYGQAHNAGLAAVMTEEQRKRRTAKLDETRQLKRPAVYYLTDLEGSKCEILDDKERTRIDYSAPIIGVDLDQFKRDCEEIDNE